MSFKPGGEMGNEENVLTVVNAGVDTLYLNVYYADPEHFTRIEQPLDTTLQETFNTLQQQAKDTRQDVKTPWSFDQEPLHMLSHGSGKQWHWILHNDLLNVQIGNGEYRGVIAHIRVSSEYLWRVNSLHYVLNDLRVFAHTLFSHDMYLVPSAVDLCADIANWSMTTLNHQAVIARARKQRPRYEEESLYVSGEEIWNGRKLGTLYIGMRTSPVHGKLYDKLKEIKDGGNKKSWFLDIYKRNGWDGEAPVTRLEVSFKREALHDLDIEKDFDLTNNLKGLWAYAVGSETIKGWLRYTIPTGDSNNRRWPLHPTWPIVQQAFDRLSEEPARELIRLKKSEVNMKAATAGLAGYLSTRTAYLCDREELNAEDMLLGAVLYELQSDLETFYQAKGLSFQDALKAKLDRYYLQDAKTREAHLKRAKSLLHNDQEAL